MIRLGRISYVNMAPVFFRLDADVEEIPGVPTELNAKLLAGDVDLAPISSIEYARNAERLRILHEIDAAIIAANEPVAIAEAVLERFDTTFG